MLSTPNHSRTILVVDDDGAVLNVCNVALSRAGYGVIMASDSTVALAMCESDAFHADLALVDAIMPGTSGPELAACLERRGVKVLMMSGYPEEQIVKRLGRAINYGQYLAKPFTSAVLLRAVRAALDPTEKHGTG